MTKQSAKSFFVKKHFSSSKADPIIMDYNINPSMANRITSIIDWGMKLLIHPQASTVAPLRFGNG